MCSHQVHGKLIAPRELKSYKKIYLGLPKLAAFTHSPLFSLGIVCFFSFYPKKKNRKEFCMACNEDVMSVNIKCKKRVEVRTGCDLKFFND